MTNTHERTHTERHTQSMYTTTQTQCADALGYTLLGSTTFRPMGVHFHIYKLAEMKSLENKTGVYIYITAQNHVLYYPTCTLIAPNLYHRQQMMIPRSP